MLERWVASIFSSYLGRYIKNLDRHGLQVSMWSGEVVLHDLELAPEALDEFDLPVIIDKGIIGQLRIEIPWKHFYSKTCKVEVSDVQLVVQPIKGTQWDEVHERKKRRLRKQTQLRIFESTRTSSLQPAPENEEEPTNEESEGFGSRLSRHILSTLQISIKNAVLRYEDSCTDPRRPVVWTIRTEELSAIPTDAEWRTNEGAYKSVSQMYRLCKLKGLTLAIDHLPVAPRLTGVSKISSLDKWKEIMSASSTLISQRCTPDPLDVELRVTTQPSYVALDLSHPKNTVDASFKCLNIRLKRWQYDAINRTARYVADFAMLDKFRQFRPSTGVKGDAKNWWLFAYKCVRLVGAESRMRTHVCWEKLKRRRELKELYIQMYKRSQNVPWRQPLSEDETAHLADVEDHLDAESIIYFRRLAYFQLRMEREQHKDAAMPEQKKEGGWWQWWTGWSDQGANEETEENAQEVWKLLDADEWTPEQKQMLYEELGIDDSIEGSTPTAQPLSMPSSYVKTRIQVTIWKGMVEMCENSATPKTAIELLECMNLPVQDIPSNLSANDLLSLDSASLTKLGVDEKLLTMYKHVFGPTTPLAVTPRITFASIQLTEFTSRWQDMNKSWKLVNTLKDIEMSSTSLTGSHYTSLIRKGASSSAHLLLATVSRVADAQLAGSYNIDVHLRPMDAIVDVTWLQTVAAFWGVGVYGKISDLETAKKQQPAPVTVANDLATALKMSLERETTVNVSVVMDQPCLIVPSDCRDLDAVALVLTADTFSVCSDPDPVEGREGRKDYLPDDYYNHYVVKSDYGKVMTTSIRRWSSMAYRDYDSVCRPLVVDAVLDLRLLASLVPKCHEIAKITMKGELRNMVIHMSRGNLHTAEQAFTNLLELAWNVTGRGSVDVARAEGEDETDDTCSTFALVLGPVAEEIMDITAEPQKQFAELDGTSGHLRLHDKHKSSKVATLVDLSSGHFEISEPHNSIMITINSDVSLWIQLPTASMHNRWLQSFKRIKAGNLLPVAVTVDPEAKVACHQTWFTLSIELGDLKVQLEEDNKETSLQSSWVLSNCGMAMDVTGHDSKFELKASSLVVTDSTSEQLLWSNEGDPGFSVWWLSFMPSSKYFDPMQTQQALMQMGINTKGMGLHLSVAAVEAMEMIWDLINISLKAKQNTVVYAANKIVREKVEKPPELPKPFEQKQGIGFFVEVEGEIDMSCQRPDGQVVMRVGGEDFSLQFFDTPYGIAMDGMLHKPWLENALTEGKWTRFLHYNEKSRLDFEYVNFQNRGALKGDATPPRPSYYHGLAFTHQVRMNLAHAEVTYFQAFLWTILEYFKTGLCSRLAWISWRPVFDGKPMVIPFDAYDPMATPTEPYYDMLKTIIECEDLSLVLPPTIDSDSGIFKAHAEHIGVINELVKTDEDDVLYVTMIDMKDLLMEAPDEMADEVPKGWVFSEPTSMTLCTTHSMVDPYQRHPKTKLCLDIPNECVMYYSDRVYCSLLTWLTKSLMEPWKPHFPTPPQAPLPYTQLVDTKRYNFFTWAFNFADLSIIWLETAIPMYTLQMDMAMAIRWFANDDFENDVAMKRFRVCEGVNSDIVMQLDDDGVMKTEIVWRTPDEGRRIQELTYTIDKKLLVVLDHRVLINVVDSLLSSQACRNGGYKLLGWVEPDDGWPAPGEPWVKGPPAEHIIRHVVKMKEIDLRIPNVCEISTSSEIFYEWQPGGARSLDLSVSKINMKDVQNTKVITSQQEETALSLHISKKSEEGKWEKATGRVGELHIVATVVCFSSLYQWGVGPEFKLLCNIWAPTPEHRLEAIKVRPVKESATPEEVVASKLVLPIFDLAWNRPKVAILCSNKPHRGFIIDFGLLSLVTSKTDKDETVTATLVDLAVKSVFRDDYVLRPSKAQISFTRTDIKSDTERRVVAVEGEAIESFFDFSDVRTIAAVAYDYSATLSKLSRERPAKIVSEKEDQTPQQLLARARTTTTDTVVDTELMHIAVTLPLVSLSLESGGSIKDDLNLPELEEPKVKSTISISGLTGTYAQRTTGQTDLEASFERFGIDSEMGPVLEFEGTNLRYKQGDGTHGDQNIDLNLGKLTLVIVPQFFFGVMNFVYLPYAAATMPDTFAAPDVIIIDSDYVLPGDMVLNRDKKLMISGAKQNLVKINGNGCELHLIGDKPLIQIDAGVTLVVVATKLYLYNKEVMDFVDADDGACIYLVPDKNEIDRGVPPITAWAATEEEGDSPVSVRITAKFSLSMILPEKQERLKDGIELRFNGEGGYVWTTLGKDVLDEEALITVKDFSVRPMLSEMTHLLEPVEIVNIVLKENLCKLHATSFHVRLSSADAGLISRALISLQTSLAIISKQAKLKMEKNDADIIRDAIVKSQQEKKEVEAVSRTGEIVLPTVDVLVVEDSSGFDIPLFFAQLLCVELKGSTTTESQKIDLVNATVNLDYYNLENCEWESVLSKPIHISARVALVGQHKKDLNATITPINTLITPQLVKTLVDSKRFGDAFSPQPTVQRQASIPPENSPTKAAQKTTTQFRMYEVTNQTGYSLELSYQGEVAKLVNLDSVHFNFGKKYGKEVLHCVNLCIEGQEVTTVVDIGKVGTAGLTMKLNDRNVKLFCSVQLTDTGRKKVTIRSSVVVVNTTPHQVLITAGGDMISHPGGSVSIPHAALTESFIQVKPIMDNGFEYKMAQLGLPFGFLHKLHHEMFVLTSPAMELNEDSDVPADFQCYVDINTDVDGVGDTTITLLPIFAIQNLTGLSIKYTLYTWDGNGEQKRSIKKLFKKSKKGVQYVVAASGDLPTDDTTHVCQANPFHAMYLDIDVVQPTGEVIKRHESKFNTPFLVRNPGKNHQGRVSTIVLSDQRGRQVHLAMEYSERMITVFCPLWIINQTAYCLELAVHNPMKLAESAMNALTAGQNPGEGIKPGSKPFLMAPPDLPEKEQVGHLYVRILRVGKSIPQWSAKIDISKVGGAGTIECPERSGDLPKTIAFSIEFPWGKVATRTKVIKFTPRWIIHNRMPKAVTIRHEVRGAGVVGQERPKSLFVVSSQNTYQEYEGGASDNFIAIKRTDGTDPKYCKPFTIDRMGDNDVNLTYTTTIKKRSKSASPTSTLPSEESEIEIAEFDVVKVASFQRGSIVYITIDPLRKPPYVIENRTPYPVWAKQREPKRDLKSGQAPLRFPPKTTRPFIWVFPEAEKVMDIKVGLGEAVTINLDPRHQNRDSTTGDDEGTMKECHDIGESPVYLRVRHRHGQTMISLTLDKEIDKWFVNESLLSTTKLNIQGVAAVLVSNEVEIAHLSLQSIVLYRKRDKTTISYSTKIGALQLDDQKVRAEFPVVICNKIPKDRSPFFLLDILRKIDRSSGAIHIQTCRAKFQPLIVKLRDKFLYSLLKFYQISQKKIEVSNKQEAKKYYTVPVMDASLQVADKQDGLSTRHVYIEHLQIDAITLQSTLVRSQVKDQDFFKHMLGMFSVLVRGFEDMTLVWPKIEVYKLCNKAWLIGTMLKDKYYSETTSQLLRVAPGVAKVHTFVTDLLSTMPGRDQDQIEYQTPSRRVRDPAKQNATVIGTTRPQVVTSPQSSPRVIPTLQTFSSTGGSPAYWGGSLGTPDPRTEDTDFSREDSSVFCDTAPTTTTSLCVRQSSHFGIGKAEDEVLFHECNSKLMTKQRAVDLKALKKKSWEKFHPSNGRTSWEEFSQSCTWEEFYSHTTELEFKTHVNFALDQYIRITLAVKNKHARRDELCRCLEVEDHKRKQKDGLHPPSHASSQSIRLSWFEFAHHTTWDEFRNKTTVSEFRQHAAHARDCCLSDTIAFAKLDREQVITMFNM